MEKDKIRSAPHTNGSDLKRTRSLQAEVTDRKQGAARAWENLPKLEAGQERAVNTCANGKVNNLVPRKVLHNQSEDKWQTEKLAAAYTGWKDQAPQKVKSFYKVRGNDPSPMENRYVNKENM